MPLHSSHIELLRQPYDTRTHRSIRCYLRTSSLGGYQRVAKLVAIQAGRVRQRLWLLPNQLQTQPTDFAENTGPYTSLTLDDAGVGLFERHIYLDLILFRFEQTTDRIAGRIVAVDDEHTGCAFIRNGVLLE